ncbi:NHLP leader peptide family natural product precursor [Thiocystis minor]|uniref:NHLP leader peptide family RiPP precursor n=1 Tax=Thiocystis minor TaxID=61597 RepID=UPI001912E6F9|nr:NHLP leader peptide family RiPP precursor [Thiocystis minor]MBK5966215.1 NHLP leader peptide family natural product precursor [Thiocystis minor]
MNDQAKPYQQLIAKCWADDTFKQRLLADPAGTLAAEGIDVPAGVSVMVVENTEQVFHLVIPARPSELSDDELRGADGGSDARECFGDAYPYLG